MASEPGSPSMFSIYSLSKNSHADLSVTEEAKQTIKQVMFAKNVPKPHSPSNFQKALAELIGTYIVIFLGCGSALVDRVTSLTIVGIGLIWGLVFMALVYALGHISGAHFNPAVTIAFGAACRLPLLQVPIYVLSQLLGSTLAFQDQHDILPALTQYKGSTGDLEAIAWEFIITFILMFITCGAASDNRATIFMHQNRTRPLSRVAIGVTMLFNVIIAGPITGASMNPGRSIGPAIVTGVYKNLWVFVVAPILGALAATLVCNLLRVPEPGKEETVKITHNDMYLHPDV